MAQGTPFATRTVEEGTKAKPDQENTEHTVLPATLVRLPAAAAAAAAEEHDEPVESANNDGTEKVYMHIKYGS